MDASHCCCFCLFAELLVYLLPRRSNKKKIQNQKNQKKLVYSFIFRARVALTQYFAVDQIDVLTELFFLFFGRFLDLAQVCKGDVLGVEGLCARMQLGARACVYKVGYLSDMCAVGMYLCTCAQVYFLIHEFKFFRELLGQFVIF